MAGIKAKVGDIAKFDTCHGWKQGRVFKVVGSKLYILVDTVVWKKFAQDVTIVPSLISKSVK